MKISTLKGFLPALISLGLISISTPSFAQHGGGHAGGGGGGMHGGGGGGFHGGGSFGAHGGGYPGGGYGGGYRGGSAYGGRAGSPGMRGAAPGQRGSNAARPWSWEGHSTRDASPGWHQFASGSGASTARSGGANAAGRSGEIARSSPNFTSHAAAADGNWHSFAAANHATTSTNGRVETASIAHSGFAMNNFASRGNLGVWRGGWRGGWGWGGGWGWRWGWAGWNWGWGWGWGCCGWGWGWGFGWGWGWWGPGWSVWAPFWAWPAYYYNPWLDSSWLYSDDSPAPYVLDPYPA